MGILDLEFSKVMARKSFGGAYFKTGPVPNSHYENWLRTDINVPNGLATHLFGIRTVNNDARD